MPSWRRSRIFRRPSESNCRWPRLREQERVGRTHGGIITARRRCRHSIDPPYASILAAGAAHGSGRKPVSNQPANPWNDCTINRSASQTAPDRRTRQRCIVICSSPIHRALKHLRDDLSQGEFDAKSEVEHRETCRTIQHQETIRWACRKARTNSAARRLPLCSTKCRWAL